MNKKKGQALIEFALVLPFFLTMVFGIIYSGMLFYDYSTVSNIARSAARERAITKTVEEDSSNGKSNEAIIKNYFDNGRFKYGLVTSLYRPASDALKIDTSSNAPDIIVTVTMEIDSRSYIMQMILPEKYSVVYHMRKDYTDTLSSSS